MQNQFTTEDAPLSPLTPPVVQLEERTTEAVTDTHTAQAIQKRLKQIQRNARRDKVIGWSALLSLFLIPALCFLLADITHHPQYADNGLMWFIFAFPLLNFYVFLFIYHAITGSVAKSKC